jgi:hypothetical protein
MAGSTLIQGAYVIKLFTSVIDEFCNKLESLPEIKLKFCQEQTCQLIKKNRNLRPQKVL